jgi:maltooligosyltrehalose trehalohydrolase
MSLTEISARFAISGSEFGVTDVGDGESRFRLWAPAARQVDIVIEGSAPFAMERSDNGWFETTTCCSDGVAYEFILDDNLRIFDPAARAVRTDTQIRSVVYDSRAYSWRTPAWKGRPWSEAVLYELHVGVLKGFCGVMELLPRLAELGVTAIELMPVNAFPGARNWGYDGVLQFAPCPAYGTPDELKALVDRAHELGLMMFLDVVYNHFGPEGNYIDHYAPQFFRDDVQTPWGRSIDFETPEVRRFFTENALYWLEEFRFDGLRFDAAHAITHPDWLDETVARIRETLPRDRHVHFVLENDNNVSSHMRDGYFSAQWNDDAHHVMHVLLTGETTGYYAAYSHDTAGNLALSLAEGFVFQGVNRLGAEKRGTPSGDLSPQCFVFFLQNHDQVGNRALGERLTTMADPRALEAALVLQLLSPHIPLIFMGEEDASQSPFQFFSDLSPPFAQSVRDGRKREFGFDSDTFPDPGALDTFLRSTPLPDGRNGERRFRYYQRLLALRRERISPHLIRARSLGAIAVAEKAVVACWRLGDGEVLTIVINLGLEAVVIPALTQPLLFESEDGAHEDLGQGQLRPYSAVALLGHQTPPLFTTGNR